MMSQFRLGIYRCNDRPVPARLVAASTILGLVLGCASTKHVAELTQSNEELRKSLAAAEQEADGLKADLASLAAENTAAQRMVELRASLQATEQQRADLATRTESCEVERERLRDERDKANASLEELRREHDALKKLAGAADNPLVRVAIAEWKIVEHLQGAVVVAQDDEQTYLGIVDFAGRSPDSIFNEFGLHGSEFGIESIWNNVGFFGSEVGLYSVRNDVCLNPPMLVKNRQILGYVTTNEVYSGTPRFDPNYLLNLARRLKGDLGVSQ